MIWRNASSGKAAMGAILHISLGCVYSVAFIVGFRCLRAGEVNRAAKYGIAFLLAVGLDIILYASGVGLFS
jgi:hypothetical protein